MPNRTRTPNSIANGAPVSRPEGCCALKGSIQAVPWDGNRRNSNIVSGVRLFECTLKEGIREIVKHRDIYRILTDSEGNWALHGSDKDVAREFISIGGIVGLSKAYYDGEHIKVIDGFLKQYEGKIVRVNHRAKTAQIHVELNGKIFTLWVGFELIYECDTKSS